jgi:hypothetical protein
MKLNQSVLDRLMSWGQQLAGFRPVDAVNALTIVQGYVEGARDERGHFVEGVGTGDPEKLCLFAMDLTWMFWLDELFDAPNQHDLIDIEPIIHAMKGGVPSTPAAAGFSYLREQIDPARFPADEYRLWTETAVAIPEAWRVEQQLSKKQLQLSYSEYLENGFNSSGVPHIVATASLLYGFGLAARLSADDDTRSLFRTLSLFCRLQNDLASVTKEREEGTMANAVFIMERFVPAQHSPVFVAEELKGYERRLSRDIDRLSKRDGRDQLCRMARVMPQANKPLYTNPSGDYAASA